VTGPVLSEPQLARRGDLFVATSEAGLDGAVDGGPPDEAVREAFAAAFESLRSTVEGAGRSLDELGRVFVTVPERALRRHINEPWLALFPGDNRPARRTTTAAVAPGCVVQLSATGVADGERVPIELDGLAHKDPLPNGARLGGYFFSSAITSDAPTGGRPEGAEGITQTWRNLESFVAAAGGTLDDVLNVWVFLGQWELHDEMVQGWVDLFPSENWPSRKTFRYPETPIQVICDGVIGVGARGNFELEGLHHHDPIPLAASLGSTLTTSGINATVPGSDQVVEGMAAQAEQTLTNLADLLAPTSFDLGSVLEIVGLARDDEAAAALRALGDRLRAQGDGPVLRVMQLGREGRQNGVQLLVRCSAPGA
jgi:enamine deaminase RidA (YjgF/YER057c/UK114 family)